MVHLWHSFLPYYCHLICLARAAISWRDLIHPQLVMVTILHDIWLDNISCHCHDLKWFYDSQISYFFRGMSTATDKAVFHECYCMNYDPLLQMPSYWLLLLQKPVKQGSLETYTEPFYWDFKRRRKSPTWKWGFGTKTSITW